MNSQTLSAEVRIFIDRNISSFEDLQVLLLLHSHPNKMWDAIDVAEKLRIEPISASGHLMDLFSKGLLEHEDRRGPFYGFQFNSQSGQTEGIVSEVASFFQRARMVVVDHIQNKNRTNFG